MTTPNGSEDIFIRAERLFHEGQRESATLLMCDLLCGSTQADVRERAAKLFAVYTEKRYVALPSESGTDYVVPPATQDNGNGYASSSIHHPVPRPVEQKPPSANGMNRSNLSETPRVDRSYIFALREKRERRLQDTSIPPDAILPNPLTPYLIKYLRISDRSLAVPGLILTIVRDIETSMQQLPPGRTQVEVHALLQSFLDRFNETPVGVDVFVALVNIFYANGFLNTERAQDLSTYSEMGSQARTVRELLHADD